ncbi:MAG: hypothetical protein K9G39_05075 [Chlorobium sp.]|uniref:hypothetical protein n=1 Tax=Chlorobium sp. TaxID=1095 RepID=UPI0025B7C496|nr:hypothetical protein [Chlorobium sp.]MCF8382954.1 hypothetical protein [Chlorobium sp.]
MKKQIWITAGIAGMLLGGVPQANANADVVVHVRTSDRPAFVINSWPDFIYVPKLGFSVSTANSYDIIRYGNYYYVYRQGYWYRSSSHRGQWVVVRENRLPRQLRKYRWAEIRRHRDIEYRKKHGNRWVKKEMRPPADRRMESRDDRRFEERRNDRNDNGNRSGDDRR